jgi:segregation and condensation protein B
MSANSEAEHAPTPGRFTLERLSSAFAQLMGAPSVGSPAVRPQIAIDSDDDAPQRDDQSQLVTPRMIVEGMLFVGAADGRPLTSDEMAAHIRNVTPQEVDALVAELNGTYAREGAAYEIVSRGASHRLQLRPDLAPVRERFRGRVRAAQLTPAALEVLSIVAYKQPVAGDDVNRLRGSRSQAILAQLVRRQLVRVERPASAPRRVLYRTTERFNRLFAVNSPADLPRSEDLDDS